VVVVIAGESGFGGGKGVASRGFRKRAEPVRKLLVAGAEAE
jgi:hypothetical protein